MPSSPTARDAAEGLAEQIERLRVASEAASAGEAFTCGPPWFTWNYGVLVGSPDPHAGTLIADTDTTAFEGPDRDDIDRDANATFIAEAWNFARLILGRPDLLAALRSAGTEGGETQGAVEMREAAKIACLDLADVYREAGEDHIRNGAAVKARQALDWADGAMMCAHAVAKLHARTTDGGEA